MQKYSTIDALMIKNPKNKIFFWEDFQRKFHNQLFFKISDARVKHYESPDD